MSARGAGRIVIANLPRRAVRLPERQSMLMGPRSPQRVLSDLSAMVFCGPGDLDLATSRQKGGGEWARFKDAPGVENLCELGSQARDYSIRTRELGLTSGIHTTVIYEGLGIATSRDGRE